MKTLQLNNQLPILQHLSFAHISENVQDSRGVSATEMTYIVSGGA